jgi:DNA recombination-dependent growth factor C
MDFDLRRVERVLGAQVIRTLMLEQRVEELEAEKAALLRQVADAATELQAKDAGEPNGKVSEAKPHAARAA